MTSNFRKIGKIRSAHGLKGEWQVLIFSREASWAKQLNEFRLTSSEVEDGNGKGALAFKAERAKPIKDGIILKAETVPDRTEAEKYKGFFFWIPESHFQSKKGETIFLTEIEGFEIFNPSKEKMGHIIGFADNGAQDLLIVEKEDHQKAEIPFVKEFIVEIIFAEKKIILDLPEGIWNLDEL